MTAAFDESGPRRPDAVDASQRLTDDELLKELSERLG
jgi:hypothetical protein